MTRPEGGADALLTTGEMLALLQSPSREESLALLREVLPLLALAPSVHNVQPARWSVLPDGRIALLRACDRVLPVADRKGTDVRVSLGAALEALSLAVGARGWRFVTESRGLRADVDFGAPPAGHELVASVRLTRGGSPDPLAALLARRRSWRGPLRATAADRAAVAELAADDTLVLDATHARDVARLMDEATWAFEQRADHHAELWQWLRLDPADPRYGRDGLTAEALLLSPVARRLARVALHPRPFALLQWSGLGRALVSEAAAVRSAAGFLAFTPPRTLDDVAAGRAMHRLWLRAEAAGVVLAPMSALVDHAPTRDQLAKRLELPKDRRLAQLFRAGGCPVAEPPASPRLPPEELLLPWTA